MPGATIGTSVAQVHHFMQRAQSADAIQAWSEGLAIVEGGDVVQNPASQAIHVGAPTTCHGGAFTDPQHDAKASGWSLIGAPAARSAAAGNSAGVSVAV